ncbi:MAG TPA: chemotaxis protein CheB [Longimicrobiales bacterium]|nr:chemotaxis protein CheB [Longimicrobiales bacterium]
MAQTLASPEIGPVTRGRTQRTPRLGIVGIGASAGGLKALQAFFEAVTVDSGLAYVVIMHLDPERKSRIAALLQDRTRVPVTMVTGTTQVEANHIYVIPPGHDLEMTGDSIGLVARGDRPQHLPIDLFFRSLARVQGADAIAVVLSGTGEDGTAGVRGVKERGGITVAQMPGEADFDGMPASAIASGQIDLVLASSEIPAELVRMRRQPSPLDADALPLDTEAQLSEIFSVLRDRTGHDFSLYKRPTLLRRLERRLRFNGVKSLAEYLPVLRAGEAESEALVRDLLISVSAFFRDPAAFAELAAALPALFEGKGPDDAVRVWVVGCATGEEAYSIAILLYEYAADLAQPPRIQIFATDIDEKGYAWGREALYPAAAVADIPSNRRRFFGQEAGGFRVAKELREGVLFAVHNVLHDPPFSRLDLISCRNLLIYLQPEAQTQVMETFHYALRPGGLLFLGTSETSGDNGLFVQVADEQRIYRRDDSPHPAPPRLSSVDPSRPSASGVPASTTPPPRPADFSWGGLHLRMLEAYAPPSLIVDQQLNIVHLSGKAGEFLQLGVGEPSHNVIELARGDLRMELRSALYQAFEKGVPTHRRVRLGGGADASWFVLQVHPSNGDESSGRFALVVFGEAEVPAAALDATSASGDGSDPTRPASIELLEEELRRTKEQLESTSSEHERTVEALQSANEEMQSVNEEQRAATEELETSREEIQSINEELTTINQEHQSTIEELKRTNADLENLIESTEIGTIFVDRELGIRRFTPSAAALFNFVSSDQGRSLAHITHRLDYPTLIADVASVLSSLQRTERAVTCDTGESYIVRINPYRALDGGNDGAVITFFDNSVQKRVEEELRQSKIVAESANRAKATFLATLSHEFRTPLNGILGWAELMHLDGELTESQLEKVKRIESGGWHLASMIDEILTFAKLDEGRETLTHQTIDAAVTAREAGALIEPAALAKGVTFLVDVPDEPVVMETDVGKLRQILLNLCGNAVKYTERGEVRLRVRPESGRVVFEVRDTGIGIAPEHCDLIFERFFQVDSANTRIAGGMGIGLAAAREFARLLSGDIDVESEVGRGTTFSVWLPNRAQVA